MDLNLQCSLLDVRKLQKKTYCACAQSVFDVLFWPRRVRTERY